MSAPFPSFFRIKKFLTGEIWSGAGCLIFFLFVIGLEFCEEALPWYSVSGIYFIQIFTAGSELVNWFSLLAFSIFAVLLGL